MLLLIDNYDSFTHNLARYFLELGQQVKVVRNDEVSLAQIRQLNPQFLVISPGPCTPNEAGISLQAIKFFAGTLPILGVCLGHQAIAQAFGAQVCRAPAVMHGKTSLIEHEGVGLFAGLPADFSATRYHSLVVKPDTLPSDFECTAWCTENDGRTRTVMGIENRAKALYGVQFHPESILTDHGHHLLRNFLSIERS